MGALDREARRHRAAVQASMRASAMLLALVAVLLAGGCGKLVPKLDKVVPDNRKTYQKAQTLPDLEVPPDLSTDAIRDRMAIPEGGDTARYSTYQERRAERERERELAESENAAIRLLENEHVLAVEGATVQVWPRLLDFWRQEGYDLELDDVELGVIETAWRDAEGELSRDKFKVFAEPGENAGTTVLYVSHEGQELTPQGQDLVWQRGPRNVDLERGVVERMQAFLSGRPAVAAAPLPRVASAAPLEEDAAASPEDYRETYEDDYADAHVAAREQEVAGPGVGRAAPATGAPRHAEMVTVGGGKVYLTVAEDFPSAWKTTGRALEKVGVAVKDSDRGRGVFIVEVASGEGGESQEGVWNKLKFWGRAKATELQVSLTGVGDKTEVVVLDKDGRWETGDRAGDLLNRLRDALNSGQI